ncbi:hypothetical protein Ngar_c09700 [Candidatus Nitrososphaera gargensis Ga9.2]|uniref:Uncharacterized protein n=1 Tax=Nitrososphaera gargensis (strain Ga9.2) TaxID=1237085 RepID=K0IIK4_NITGG|nr:hypothetical protein [Candidatus Nitrososphaera gargensis]AFU57912.1 hypothetical protein Ngar_c09700 [Candidatus Nitrososphaera gargensis Ga9.2]
MATINQLRFFIDGYHIYNNYVRPHTCLLSEQQTPAEATKRLRSVALNLQNRLKDLIVKSAEQKEIILMTITRRNREPGLSIYVCVYMVAVVVMSQPSIKKCRVIN